MFFGVWRGIRGLTQICGRKDPTLGFLGWWREFFKVLYFQVGVFGLSEFFRVGRVWWAWREQPSFGCVYFLGDKQ